MSEKLVLNKWDDKFEKFAVTRNNCLFKNARRCPFFDAFAETCCRRTPSDVYEGDINIVKNIRAQPDMVITYCGKV